MLNENTSKTVFIHPHFGLINSAVRADFSEITQGFASRNGHYSAYDCRNNKMA